MTGEVASTPLAETKLLLEDVMAFLRSYLVLQDVQFHTLALWVLHTHAFSAAEITPYLAITSPEKECGKTQILKCLRVLCAETRMVANISPAYLARSVELLRPTLLIDEADAGLTGSAETSETLRGILNSGYEIDGSYGRCGSKESDHEPKEFSTFCPKAIAGVGASIPETVLSRSISIHPRRKLREETVVRFKHTRVAERAAPLAERLRAWATEAVPPLAEAEPMLPTELGSRAADLWEPLIAIADMAGHEWPSRGRDAAIALSAIGADDSESIGQRLLRDIQTVFCGKQMRSSELVTALRNIEDAQWQAGGREWANEPLNALWLARLLYPYEIRPTDIRFDEKIYKGYRRGDFEDAWERYVPLQTGNTGNTLEHEDAGDEVAPVARVGGFQPFTVPF